MDPKYEKAMAFYARNVDSVYSKWHESPEIHMLGLALAQYELTEASQKNPFGDA